MLHPYQKILLYSTSTTKTTTEDSLLNCRAVDGRNVLWEGHPWELVQKSCDEGCLTDNSFTNGRFERNKSVYRISQSDNYA